MKAKHILLAVLVTLSMTVVAYAGPVYMDSGGGSSSGTASPAGDSGSIQYNAAGTLNGAEQILVNVNHSGTTSFFGMTNAGVTVWAMNWQGYAYAEYLNGVTDLVKSTVGTTKYFTNGTSIKELYTSAGTTLYYSGGAIEELKTSSGVTKYDAAGNVLWSTISGFYISSIDIPTGTIQASTVRSGVSRTGRGQCDVGTEASSAKGTSGVSLYVSTIGTTFKHEGPGASAYQLPPIISGATYYLRVDDPLGTGVTIYSGVSTQAIYVGSYGGDGVCIPSASAVSGYAITLFAEELSSGASRWWSTLGSSSAVSAVRNRYWP